MSQIMTYWYSREISIHCSKNYTIDSCQSKRKSSTFCTRVIIVRKIQLLHNTLIVTLHSHSLQQRIPQFSWSSSIARIRWFRCKNISYLKFQNTTNQLSKPLIFPEVHAKLLITQIVGLLVVKIHQTTQHTGRIRKIYYLSHLRFRDMRLLPISLYITVFWSMRHKVFFTTISFSAFL